jgi:amidase
MRRISFADGQIFEFNLDLKPVASVDSGETFDVVCQDAGCGEIRTEKDLLSKLDLAHVNGATGPVEVRKARVGDALRVSIRQIHTESQGWIGMGPKIGVLGERPMSMRTRIVPIRNGIASFSRDLRLRVHPHVGTIGVATAGPRLSTFYPHDHGGNLDTTEITAGNAVYLPVAQPGAQLALGDLHALMADGEVCGTAIEVGGTVRLRVDLVPGLGLHRPVVETADTWMMLGSAPSLDEAAKLATQDGVDLLARGRGMSWEDAYMLASVACDLRISQDVDPYRTCKLLIPKRLLAQLPGAGSSRGRSKGPARTR